MTPTNSSDTYYRYGSLCCSVCMVVVALFGVVGNTLSACVFSHQRRPCASPSWSPSSALLSSAKARSPINVLLIALTISDTVLLLLASPLFSTIAFYNWNPQNEYLLKPIAYMTVYCYPACMMAQCTSAWTMLVISVERYSAVCRPLASRQHGDTRKTKITLGVVIAGAVVYNACRYGEYGLNEHSNGTVALLRQDRTYVDAYVNWSYLILVFAAPFLVLLAVNTLIVRTILRARRQRRSMLLTQRNLREHKTALMMASVVLAYLACNVLALVLNSMEAVSYVEGAPLEAEPFEFLCDLNNLFIQAHSTLTFLVYFRFSGHFRTYLRARWRAIRNCGGAASRRESWEERRRVGSTSAPATRSTSVATCQRKASGEPTGRYRRPWSSAGSVLSTASDRAQGHRRAQLGLKRIALASLQRASLESQVDPFYV